jgi:hypothetical protein
MPTSFAAGDARPIPVFGTMCRISLPIFKADGTLIVDGTGQGYVSTDDGGAQAVVPVFGAANGGNWQLDLTAAQMSGNKVSGYITSTTSGACPTPFVIYTKRRGSIHSGTAQGGGASTITLSSTASNKDSAYVNCEVSITGDPGAGSIRRITGYVGSTRIATVGAAWGTQPTNASTYEILPTQEGTTLVSWKGLDIVQDAIPNVAAGGAGGLPLKDANNQLVVLGGGVFVI